MFDKVELSASDLKVTGGEIEKAYTKVDSKLVEVIKKLGTILKAFIKNRRRSRGLFLKRKV